MSRAILRVIAAGPMVSVQDGGRPGWQRFGVPESGPMDRLGFARANAAAGNPPGAAGIEVSLGGLTLDCVEGAVSLALAGGGFVAEGPGGTFGSWAVVTLRRGDRLEIRRGPWGSWCYLQPAGRLLAPVWLGSRATHAPSGLGGGMLGPGQEIVIDAPRLLPDQALPCPLGARPRGEVAVVLGPQDRFFPPAAIEALLDGPFRLTDSYDRMGVRLRGPTLAPEGALAIPSEPILRGSVQVAGDGVPTVLLADHQTTGGYPKIATIVSAHLDGFAQLRPHDRVRFRAVTPQRAVELARLRANSTPARQR
jgi:5-oxoprolinase (ATP-hydrolysing) subunit C